MGDWNLSDLEFVRIHFYSNLEIVRVGNCQNQKLSELEFVRIGICQNWNLSESDIVRIGNCQNRKLSELEIIRIRNCPNWNFVRVGICQNRQLSHFGPKMLWKVDFRLQSNLDLLHHQKL